MGSSLALFYGGLVRAKNVLSILMQCFAITALVAVFAPDTFGGNQVGVAIGRQLGVQIAAAAFTVAYSGAVTWLILRAVMALTGLRVNEADESRGLDISIHGEEGYNL